MIPRTTYANTSRQFVLASACLMVGVATDTMLVCMQPHVCKRTQGLPLAMTAAGPFYSQQAAGQAPSSDDWTRKARQAYKIHSRQCKTQFNILDFHSGNKAYYLKHTKMTAGECRSYALNSVKYRESKAVPPKYWAGQPEKPSEQARSRNSVETHHLIEE